MTCPECKGTGLVPRKYWTQGPNVEGVHPAINARRPAYLTVGEFACLRGCAKPKETL